MSNALLMIQLIFSAVLLGGVGGPNGRTHQILAEHRPIVSELEIISDVLKRWWPKVDWAR